MYNRCTVVTTIIGTSKPISWYQIYYIISILKKGVKGEKNFFLQSTFKELIFTVHQYGSEF